MSERLKIEHASRDAAIGVLDGHVVAHWNEAPSLLAIAGLERAIRTVKRSAPTMFGYYARLGADVGVPDEQSRGAFLRLGEQFGVGAACIALVLEDAGFRAAAVRGAITSVGLALRGRLPMRAFSSLADASVWSETELRKHGARALDVSSLTDAVEQLRVAASRPRQFT